MLAPATDGPDLGYVELAGWSPDGSARRDRARGAQRRRDRIAPSQVVKLDSLAVDKQTSRLADLGPARGWITPEWRGRTLALR